MTDDPPRFPRDTRVVVDGGRYRGVVRLVDGDRRFVKLTNGNTGWLHIDRLAEDTDAT